MKIRPLDADGDILPLSSLSQLIEGKDAVAQVITLRLNLLHGEWWEDPDLGFRVPDFLISNARSGDANLLSKYIASYISNTEGVRAVTDVVSQFSNHAMTFYCLALTTEGESTTVEVNMNGIL